MNKRHHPQERFIADFTYPGRGSGADVELNLLGCAALGGAAAVAFVGIYWYIGLVAGLLAAGGLLGILFGVAFVVSTLRRNRLVALDRSNPAIRQHPALGELRWDSMMKGWTTTAEGPSGAVTVYLFDGNRNEGPREPLAQIIAGPVRELHRLAPAALAFLIAQARRAGRELDPEQFALKELDIREGSSGEYFLLFERGTAREHWLVELNGSEPVRCGIVAGG